MEDFLEFGLPEGILKSLTEQGITKPSPIQARAIPILMGEEVDFIGLAQTGTGKTAAFGLPLLRKIDVEHFCTQALVLAPTRELGQQIAVQLDLFSKYLPKINVLAVYGGAAISNQIKDLKKKPQIVIATPGRLIDLIHRKAIRLDQVSHLVLDEADEMLNMGFKEDLDTILSFTPPEKNTWLFSATMPKEIRSIIKKYMTDPKEVAVSSGNTVNENIEHRYAIINNRDRTEALKRFLDAEKDMRGIIFCRTKRDTQNLAETLLKSRYRADAIHGDLSQAQRDRVMKRFKEHDLQVLVATDVAARGIDVDNLTHVIHYSLPDDFAYYTHRSGRTARAGKKGISLSLATNGDMRKIKSIQKQLKIVFNKVQIPKIEEIQLSKVQQWAEDIMAYKTEDLDKELLEKTNSILAELNKEELIKALLNQELTKLNSSGTGRDLNIATEKQGSRRDNKKDRNNRGDSGNQRRSRERSGKKGSEKSRSGEGADRFFINLGQVDDINKRDLIDFIADHVRIKRSHISNVKILNKQSYFDVDKSKSQKIARSFRGMSVGGRKLRVNRDE